MNIKNLSHAVTLTHYLMFLGHSRLTWNSMGIKEFIAAGNQQISSLISKIRQIEILRVQLQEIVDYVSQKNLLKLIMDNQDKATTLPAFDAFFKSTYDHLEKMYKGENP